MKTDFVDNHSRIRCLIANEMYVPANTCRESSSLRVDLDADDLDIASIAEELIHEFKLPENAIPESDYLAWRSVGDVIEYMHQKHLDDLGLLIPGRPLP